MDKKKRTWYMLMTPPYFNIRCPRYKEYNLAWSEYENHLWCYVCEDDIEQEFNHELYPILTASNMGQVMNWLNLAYWIEKFLEYYKNKNKK